MNLLFYYKKDIEIFFFLLFTNINLRALLLRAFLLSGFYPFTLADRRDVYMHMMLVLIFFFSASSFRGFNRRVGPFLVMIHRKANSRSQVARNLFYVL